MGLLSPEERLGLVVVGDPLGVYCKAWKSWTARHVVFKGKHKATLEKASGGGEQVNLQEALSHHPQMASGVFGGLKIGVTGSIFA